MKLYIVKFWAMLMEFIRIKDLFWNSFLVSESNIWPVKSLVKHVVLIMWQMTLVKCHHCMEILSCRREDEHDSADIWFATVVVILYKILCSEDAHLTEKKVENRQRKMLKSCSFANQQAEPDSLNLNDNNPQFSTQFAHVSSFSNVF